MYGFLSANIEKLTQDELSRYKGCYCGLCRTLRERHGELSGLTLNYDMTFLVLLLSSLYEPNEAAGHNRCLPHPNSGRAWWKNEITEYASDMNIALAYLKCCDDWDDELRPSARFAQAALRKSYDRISEMYPRQCKAMSDSISALRMLENSGVEDPDDASNIFGKLMAEIFVYKEDRWSSILRRLGLNLGKFIYLMDACVDLEEDIKRGRYNPFKSFNDLCDKDFFISMFSIVLSDILLEFDKLPILQDVGIMRNILCIGLWQQFGKKYTIEEGPADESGSV